MEGKNTFSFYLIVFLLSILILLIEGSLLAIFFGGADMPDLLLVMVTCLAFIQGERRGMVLGLLAGLLQDLLFSPAIGFFGLAKMVTAYLVGLASREIYKDQLFGLIAIVFLATFIHEFIIIFLGLLFWGGAGSFLYLLDHLFLAKTVYHLLLAMPLYLLLHRAE
ncbi:MAG TPA: rod shape-determining protein MreD, partial [Firmicutes bacterium]|nr:rod shape-determining protein MreD [Bacillota bacterium]